MINEWLGKLLKNEHASSFASTKLRANKKISSEGIKQKELAIKLASKKKKNKKLTLHDVRKVMLWFL